MENEKENELNGADTNADYIETIKNLKANSVSKDDYLKIKEDNKRLLDALSNGNPAEPAKEAEKPKESLDDLRKKVFAQENSNLDFWKNSLALRSRILEDGGEDIFLPKGHNIQVEDSDRVAAQKVADVVQQCIDFAGNDSSLFTNELQRRTNNSSPLIGKR